MTTLDLDTLAKVPGGALAGSTAETQMLSMLQTTLASISAPKASQNTWLLPMMMMMVMRRR